MSNPSFIPALNAINPDRIPGSASRELPPSCLSAYFLQLRAVLDHEKHPALIVDACSGGILSINLPAFEQLGMNAVGLSLRDFVQGRDAYSTILQCAHTNCGTQLTTRIHTADGQVTACAVMVAIASAYTQWLLVIFTENLPLCDRSDAERSLNSIK